VAFLELRNVSKRYRDLEVLRGINLSIERHSVVCLIGPSGCGKSTLLRCINRLEEIDGGEILLEGESITGPGVNIDAARSQIGIVFQSFNLFPHMTVLENVMLAPRVVRSVSKEAARERATALLQRFGLSDRADRYPESLSGGQQQRTAIVRALAMDPLVILLDEVTSALDPELVGEVLALLQELAREGATLVLATHELSFARAVANEVCFLYGGEIHEKGPPAQVLDDPQTERARAFTRQYKSRH